MVKDSTMFIIFGAVVCLVVLIMVYRSEIRHATVIPHQPRYDCEDNSDTTKGHYKGVLTHCVPVKITRTM